MSGYFVTGTDTGVGKTLVSAALLRAFARAGRASVGMKPIVAGAEPVAGQPVYADVEALRRASSVAVAPELTCCYEFDAPIAPHVAAQRAGVNIDLERVRRAFVRLSQSADIVIVEGVGGFKVPLGANIDTVDLARTLALPVILVVGLRLGCLNHALLTADAIRAAGLSLAGWIGSRIDPAMTAVEENIAALRERIAPALGIIPYLPCAEADTAADYIGIEPLLASH